MFVPDFGPGRFGPAPHGPVTAATTETHAVPTAAAGAPDKLLHPGNPLVAFGAVAALTFGLMAFSTSVRVGKARAAISIGDTK